MNKRETDNVDIEGFLDKFEKDAATTVDAFLHQMKQLVEGLSGTVQTETDSVRQRLDQLKEFLVQVEKNTPTTIDALLHQIKEPVEVLAGTIQTETDSVRQRLDQLKEALARHETEVEQIKGALTRFENAQTQWGPKNAGWLLTALLGILIFLQTAVLWLLLVR